MAENIKDPIDKLAESRNVPREEIVKELRELDLGAVQPDGSRSGGFAELYEKGFFDPIALTNDRLAHEAFGKALSSDLELMRAFDHYKRLNSGGKGIQEIIKEAGDGFGAASRRELRASMPGAGDVEGEFKQLLFGPYNYTLLSDGTYSAPWLKEQAQEEIGPAFQESDEERKEREALENQQKANELAEQQGAQNVFNVDQDPRTAAVRQRVDSTKFDPFTFDTQGERSQINDLLDASSRKIPAPNLGDARSVSKFNNSVSSREFVRNNALKKLRDLDNMADSHRQVVNNHLGVMTEWEAANKGKHPMADKGVENWTDQQKINFVKNFNLGNFKLDDPDPAPKGVPVFDRDGLMGFKPEAQMEKEMGGEAVKVAKVDPRTEAQKRETRTLDEIDQEIKKTGQHPFGEDPILGTNFRQEVKNREKYGPGYKQLKDQSIDLFNNPSEQPVPSFPGIARAPAAATPSMPTSYNRSMVSPDMYKKSMQDVNDVLDSVPMPAMPKRNLGPVRPSQNNLVRKTIEYPTEPSQGGLVNGTKQYPVKTAIGAQPQMQTLDFNSLTEEEKRRRKNQNIFG